MIEKFFINLGTMINYHFRNMMNKKKEATAKAGPDEYPNKLGSTKTDDKKEEEKPTASVGKATNLTVVDKPDPSKGKATSTSTIKKVTVKPADKEPEKVSVVVKTSHTSQIGLDLPSFDKLVGVRLGDDATYVKMPEIMINSISGIDNTTNKKKMKELFAEAGINTPPVVFFPAEDSLPVIYKPHLPSAKDSMRLVYSMGDLRDCVNGMGTYEEILKVDTEYVVHVIGDKVFFVDEKVAGEAVTSDVIRNTDTGYSYRWREDTVPEVVKEEAIKALDALNLELGAVDVGYIDGKAVVYGINTGGALRKTAKDKYKEAIVEYVLEKGAKIVE